MPPPRTRLDPDGYYGRLGLEPSASSAAIAAAYRTKARLLHPDVPSTGDTAAFVAVKQAYDVLSNQERRNAYDRRAREATTQPAVIPVRPTTYAPAFQGFTESSRLPRFSNLPMAAWLGFGAFFCLCLYEAVSHLMAPPRTIHSEIRPNAAIVAPLPPGLQQAMLYGPVPLRLAGTPNFYVTPAGSPAVLWRMDTEHNTLVPMGKLPPFSAVQAIRLVRQNGMLEVLVNDKGNGFISADHLAPGNATAARGAYCSFNAGPAPFDGELLERHGSGGGKLAVQNRAVQPAVVKVRDSAGAVVFAAFLGPGGHVDLEGLPEGNFRADFAIGELWSRACNVFAAGMRARRMEAALTVPGDSVLVVTADAGAAKDISDQTFAGP